MSGLRRRRMLAGAAAWVLAPRAEADGFDDTHGAWTALLRRHLRAQRGGQATRLHYAGMAADRAELGRYLAALSAVPATLFAAWPRSARQAFLINAYNAFTVELVLTRYPDLASIRDLGGVFSTPWKTRWITLLGGRVSLDDIEHAMLRRRGDYDDPRIHFAVNCASVGCPALREQAYTPAMLDAQLDDQTRRFMADRSRNRWNAAGQRLELSKIFDWYGEDFRLGHRGIQSLPAFAARHADVLADEPVARDLIRSGRAAIAFLDYDWTLNDAR